MSDWQNAGHHVIGQLHQIVMAANLDVAPYERVVNFTLLDRDFSRERGELTPKGSFNRKAIESQLATAALDAHMARMRKLTAQQRRFDEFSQRLLREMADIIDAATPKAARKGKKS